jgi:hypothetical protein
VAQGSYSWPNFEWLARQRPDPPAVVLLIEANTVVVTVVSEVPVVLRILAAFGAGGEAGARLVVLIAAGHR